VNRPSLVLSPLLVVMSLSLHAQTTPPPAAADAQAAAASAPPSPASPLTANIALTTKYKFRGQDQGNTSWFSPAIQGGFDWTQNGWYAGNWNSNVSFSNAAIEMDFYAGYRGEIVKDLGYDVGILQYYYPQKDKVDDFNTTELYAALSWQWLSLKYSHTVSKDYFGIGGAQQNTANAAGSAIDRPSGRNTGYLDLSGNVPLMDKLTLNAHVGYTRYASDLRDASFSVGEATTGLGVPNYYDYKLGLTYDLGSGFSAAAAYAGANQRDFYGDINKPRAILTISKTM
jgi:uncharacterized protein (TIGR02001 family)